MRALDQYRRKVCRVPTIIHLALAKDWLTAWSKEQQRFAYLPWPDKVLTELQELNHQEGVPAVITRSSKGDERLWLYGSDYYLGVYSTPQGGGYTLSYIRALDLEAHEELAKGALLLKGVGYEMHQQLNLIPRGSNNHWDQIRSAWKVLEQQKLQTRSSVFQKLGEFSPRYENYLYNVDNLIDVTQQLERDKYKLSKPILYSSKKHSVL